MNFLLKWWLIAILRICSYHYQMSVSSQKRYERIEKKKYSKRDSALGLKTKKESLLKTDQQYLYAFDNYAFGFREHKKQQQTVVNHIFDFLQGVMMTL